MPISSANCLSEFEIACALFAVAASRSYDLEYGSATLEVPAGVLEPGEFDEQRFQLAFVPVGRNIGFAGPQALETAALALARKHRASASVIRGDALLKKNFPLIHAVGKASAVEAPGISALRDQLEAGIMAIASDAVIFSKNAARLSNTTLFSVPGLKAETAIIAFDLEGVAVSSGSAC